MPVLKTNQKKTTPFKHGFKAEAERTSVRYRKLLGLNESDPMPASRLAAHLGIKIFTLKDFPDMPQIILDELIIGAGKDRWSAAIFSKNDKKYIIHNHTHSPYRQESDLMHELAHAICDHKLSDLQTALSNCIIPLRKYDEQQEAEAEWLGACLQLPKPALFHYFHIAKKNNSEISAIFNASEEMVRYRLSVSGVTKIKLKRA